MVQEQGAAAYLVIQQGGQPGKHVELWKDCTSIGRSRDCDIFLEDIAVHRKQASILFDGVSRYILRDDHGSGDTILNGQPVKEHPLVDGDLLSLGNTQLVFFTHEATRPFQLPVSRGKELQKVRSLDPGASAIGKLELGSLQGAEHSFELLPEMTIGRSRECSIFLEDVAVSRIHATIRQLPDKSYELEDNHSASGTFVNGRTVTRCRLKAGDVIQIGANKLTFRLSQS